MVARGMRVGLRRPVVFIATLGMSSILAATQVIVSHNAQPLPPTGAAWNNFTQTTVGGFQIVVLYMLIIAFVLWWLTAHKIC